MRFRVLLACAALGALAGCGGSPAGDTGSGEPPIGPVPALLAAVDLRLPVQDYLRTGLTDDVMREQIKLYSES